jgi:cell division septation protein DedD
VPQALGDAVMRAMSRDHAERFQTTADLAGVIARFGGGTFAVGEEMARGAAKARTALGRLGDGWNLTPPPTQTGTASGISTAMEWTDTRTPSVAPGSAGRRAAIAILAVLVVAGGLAAGWWFGLKPFLDSKNKGEASPPAAALAPAQSGAVPAAPAPAVPIEKAPAGAETMVLDVKAGPEGATIYLDGAPLASNGFRGDFVKSGDSHLLEVRLEGHDTHTEWLKFDGDLSRSVTLSPSGKGKKKVKDALSVPPAELPPATQPSFVVTKTPPPVEDQPIEEEKPAKEKKGIIEDSPY